MRPNEPDTGLSLIRQLRIQKGKRSFWISATEIRLPHILFLAKTRSYLERISTEEIGLRVSNWGAQKSIFEGYANATSPFIEISIIEKPTKRIIYSFGKSPQLQFLTIYLLFFLPSSFLSSSH